MHRICGSKTSPCSRSHPDRRGRGQGVSVRGDGRGWKPHTKLQVRESPRAGTTAGPGDTRQHRGLTGGRVLPVPSGGSHRGGPASPAGGPGFQRQEPSLSLQLSPEGTDGLLPPTCLPFTPLRAWSTGSFPARGMAGGHIASLRAVVSSYKLVSCTRVSREGWRLKPRAWSGLRVPGRCRLAPCPRL